MQELADRWEELCPRPDPETNAHNVTMLRPFVALHGGKRLDAVTVFMARQFAVKYASNVRYVKSFFADAVRLGLLDESPFAEVGAPQSEGRASLVPPTYAQILAAAQHAEPHFADFILGAAFTGCRLSELARIEAKDVLSDTRMRIRHGKGGKERTVAVFDHAHDVLWRRRPEVGLVWTDAGGRRWDRRKVSRCWSAAKGRANIEASFHCTRAFFITWMLDQGKQPLDIARQVGHTDKHGRPRTELIERLYGHPDPEEALGRLEALA